MLLKPMNLLILDEPTNHLDIQSKDILLDALKSYNGTIIFVSHDRSFMEALSTKTLELSPQGPDQPAAARLFYGNYGYYLDRIAREEEHERGSLPPGSSLAAAYVEFAKQTPKDLTPQAASLTPPPSQGGSMPPRTPRARGAPLGTPASAAGPQVILIKAGQERPMTAGERRETEKQKQAHIRRLQRQEDEILKALATLEAEKAALEAELAQPAVYSNGEKARATKARLDSATAEAEAKSREWEAAAAELQQFSV
jgi:ATP-binding cassette subfamily F protein 3